MLQGEREFAGDNRTLGQFNLTGMPPAPRGVPQIEVAFKIDADGILNVHAKDLATGKEQSIEIKGSSGLESSEIESMRKDAESHAAEDQKRRELVDMKNQGDAMAYQVEKMLKDQGEKVEASDRGSIESALSELREALKGDDGEAIKRKMSALESASHKVAEAMYKATGQTAQQASPSGEPPPDEPKKDDGEDVIDAEYEVKE